MSKTKNKRQIRKDAHFHVAMLIDSALGAGAVWGSRDEAADEEYLEKLDQEIEKIRERHFKLGGYEAGCYEV